MSKTYKEIVEQLQTKRYGEWNLINTNHGRDRVDQRANDTSDADWEDFIGRCAKKIKSRNVQDGEHMFHHPKTGLTAVLNVRHADKQLRAVTLMKKQNPFAKPGTKKYILENWIDVSDEMDILT